MTLTQIKGFIQLINYGSFSIAADALFIAQSTLSKHVIQMEEELGVKLLVRKSRGMELTEAGREFFDFAKTVDADYEALHQKLRRQSEKKIVLVSIPASLWAFSPVIEKYTAMHPDVKLIQHERDQDEIILAVSELNADVMLTWDDNVPSDGYTVIPIMPSQLCIGVGKGHPLASVRTISLYELRNQPFIMLHQTTVRHSLIRQCRRAGFTPDVQHYVTTTDTMLRFVREGKGVAFVYTADTRDSAAYLEDIHVIQLEESIGCNMSLVLPNRKISPQTKSFVDFFKLTYMANAEKLKPEYDVKTDRSR